MRLTLIVSLLLGYFSLAAQPTDTPVLELLDACEQSISSGVPPGGYSHEFQVKLKCTMPNNLLFVVKRYYLISKVGKTKKVGQFMSARAYAKFDVPQSDIYMESGYVTYTGINYASSNIYLSNKDCLYIYFENYHEVNYPGTFKSSPVPPVAPIKEIPRPLNCLRLVTSVGIIDIPIPNWRFEKVNKP